MTREKAIDIIKCLAWYTRPNEEDIERVIKALEQEPFINKPCVSNGVCEHDKQKVLDKIRAEIVDLGRRTMNDNRASGIWACRDIIDKYKADSEEK